MGAMGTKEGLWGPYGDSMGSRSRLVAKCSKAMFFESILKLAKGGLGYRALNHGGVPQIWPESFQNGCPELV